MERRGLLDWLEDPRAGHGLRFAEDGGGWSPWEYPRLARATLAQAERIVQGRAQREGVVSIVTGSGPGFVAAFMGALAAGNTPSPLSPPGFGADPAEYVERMAAALRVAAPALVLADEALLGLVGEAARRAGLGHEPQALAAGETEAAPSRAAPAELALLQFTSGSTGQPRGVRVTWENLEANVATIGRWLGLGPEEATATWLPLYHDMGLIGCLLTPIVNQTDVWILRPEQFVADPARWLGCFGSLGASLTASPTFGFAYAARKVGEEALAEMDFSSWRVAIVGAERVDPVVLGRFAERLRPHRFSPAAFLPAYGLAEATLAVTGLPPGSGARAIRPEWDEAQSGKRLRVAAEASLEQCAEGEAGAGWLVGCGPPHPGTAVAIVDEEGRELPPGHVGEIVVRGEAVAAGYEGESAAHATRFEDGAVHTADAGVLLDGELFVVGRLGDAISARGRTVFAEDVETRLSAVEGVRSGRCVVLAGAHEGTERVVAVVEGEPGAWAAAVAAVIRSQVGSDVAVEVWAGDRGTIMRTSSGKPRRRPMWEAFCEDRLAAERIWPLPGG
ncbi:MAG: AMP-binding protein [Solirubrobacterales bacterium]